MVLDSRIRLIRDHFNIKSVEDWCDIDPRDILNIDNVGPVTLDMCRLFLAGQGLALKNDRTPEYWNDNLGHVKIVHQMGDEDRDVVCPFTILVDTGEQQAFDFRGMRADADQDNRLLIINTELRSLGRHPNSLGDYSIDGFVGQAHVERKSVNDIQGTLLGFKSEARARFESELENLSKVTAAIVVVEGSLLNSISVPEGRGSKPSKLQAKILLTSILAIQQDYRVPWLFCDSRRLAETATFKFLQRFYRKKMERSRESARLLAEI